MLSSNSDGKVRCGIEWAPWDFAFLGGEFARSIHPLATISGHPHDQRVNRIVVALAIAGPLFLTACGFFGAGAGEEFRQEPGRTVYRSADGSPPDEAVVAGKKEKVPGE